MHVLGEGDVLMEMILEALGVLKIGSSLLEMVIRLLPEPETSDAFVVV